MKPLRGSNTSNLSVFCLPHIALYPDRSYREKNCVYSLVKKGGETYLIEFLLDIILNSKLVLKRTALGEGDEVPLERWSEGGVFRCSKGRAVFKPI